MTDYEYAAPHRRVFTDDLIPFCTPWRAIPWLEAICGCDVLYADGSLRPDHYLRTAEDLTSLKLPAGAAWLDRMLQLTRQQVAAAPDDCFVSPSILRGPADVIAAMRGQVEFFTDVVDSPQCLRRAADTIADLFITVLRQHFDIVPPKLGGYAHSYGYWSPHPTVVIQSDAMGMCGPKVYRDLFWEPDARIVEALGRGVLYHLHSTGCQHYRDVLDLPGGLPGVELSIESTGPSLVDLVPVLRAILERSRLVLFVEHHFDQLPHVLRQIPHDGLFVIIPDTHIDSDKAFNGFIAANWPKAV